MATAEKFSAKEAAIQLGTDARTLRKFIRSSDDFDAVGQGNRYEFTSKEIKALKKKFDAWSGGKAPKVNGTKISKNMTEEELGGEEIDPAELDDGVDYQDEVDATTEEVDLDEDDEPADLSDLDPDDEDLLEIELTDEDLDID